MAPLLFLLERSPAQEKTWITVVDTVSLLFLILPKIKWARFIDIEMVIELVFRSRRDLQSKMK